MKRLEKFNNKFFACYFLLVAFCFSLFTFSFPHNNTNASSFWLDAYSEGFNDGSGTESSPYIISTKAHFAFFAQRIESGDTHFQGASYALGNTIDVSDHLWAPLNVTDPNFNFFGNLHGIEGLTLTDESYLRQHNAATRSGGFFQTFNGTITHTSFNDVNIITHGVSSHVATIADEITATGVVDYIQIVNLYIKSTATTLSGITRSNAGMVSNTFITGNILCNYTENYSKGTFYTSTLTGTTAISDKSATHRGTAVIGSRKSYSRKLVNDSTSVQWTAGLVFNNTGTLRDCYFAGKIDSKGSISFRRTSGLSNYDANWTHSIIWGIHGYSSASVNGISMRFNCGTATPKYYTADIADDISISNNEFFNINYNWDISQFNYLLSPISQNAYSTIENCYYYIEPDTIEYQNGEYYTYTPDDTFIEYSRTSYEMKHQYINGNYISDSSNINFGYPRLKGFYWEDEV